ncbi:MAG: hypothetical protein PUB89_03140 [Oscillospiraceae bacterium]|nr:hypothetical protein [Oscillospiraceae bacterium]
MEYLKTVLDIQVTYKSIEDLHLPNFIMSRYRIRKVFMDSVEAFFLYPVTELEEVGTLKKHISRIQKMKNIPVVLILKQLTYRQKEYLLREKVPFVVDGK